MPIHKVTHLTSDHLRYDSRIFLKKWTSLAAGEYITSLIVADCEENDVSADWLLRPTTAQRNWGFGLCFLYLRNVKGFKWNHKRVYRIYRELELNPRNKPRKRLVRERPEPWVRPPPSTKSGRWILWTINWRTVAVSGSLTCR